jgi:ubiquitin-protein ligase
LVKQLFHAFINRSQAYDYANHIGLTVFSTDVSEVCPLTPLFEVFRDHVDRAEAEGETRVYDAISAAAKALIKYKQDHTDCKLRILCLSDGEDTKSDAVSWDVAKLVQQNGIVVDTILIGEGGDNKVLRAISKCSGGYCFNPKTLPNALKLNELETMLTMYERPEPRDRQPVMSYQSLMKFADLWLHPLDLCDDETVPQRRQPDALKGAVLSLEKTLTKLTRDVSDEPTEAEKQEQNRQVVAARTRIRRIMKEISYLTKNPHPAFDIYPNRDDISFWKIVMEAPNESPYKGGVFVMYMSFPVEFPLLAPEVRFVTPVRHCNVNQYGKICHSIFTRNWTADTTIARIIECVFGYG